MLLDTHVLIRLAEGSAELPRRSRERIDQAAAGNGLAVSAISFWEVAMLSVASCLARDGAVLIEQLRLEDRSRQAGPPASGASTYLVA